MNESSGFKAPVTPFEEALAQNRQLDRPWMRFLFSPKSYRSVKDTVQPEDRGRVCPVCHFPKAERGWVRMDWPVGHRVFGRPIPCPACNRR